MAEMHIHNQKNNKGEEEGEREEVGVEEEEKKE